MSYDMYKKVAIEILPALESGKKSVVAISSSNNSIDSYAVAKELANALVSIGLSVAVVDAKIGDSEVNLAVKPQKVNEKLHNISFEKGGQAMTAISAKNVISEIKEVSDISIIALDNLTDFATALMLLSVCDGVILAERTNSSRTDHIDKTVQIINNICVKPLGFILV